MTRREPNNVCELNKTAKDTHYNCYACYISYHYTSLWIIYFRPRVTHPEHCILLGAINTASDAYTVIITLVFSYMEGF